MVLRSVRYRPRGCRLPLRGNVSKVKWVTYVGHQATHAAGEICAFRVWVKKLEWRWTGGGIESYIKHAARAWGDVNLKDATTQLMGGSYEDPQVPTYANYAITRRRNTQPWTLMLDNPLKLSRSAKSTHVRRYWNIWLSRKDNRRMTLFVERA